MREFIFDFVKYHVTWMYAFQAEWYMYPVLFPWKMIMIIALSFVQLRSFNFNFFFFTITGSELLQNNWLRNFTISWQMDVGMRTVKMRIAHQVPNLSWKIRNVMLLHYKLCSYLKIKLDYVMFNQAKFPELLNRYGQAPVLVEHHHVNRLLHPQLHLYRLILIMRHVWSQVHQVLPCQQVLFF